VASYLPAVPSKRFSAPPVVEVVCGVSFDALPQLDPVVVGAFWERHRTTYPHHQLAPAIQSEPSEGIVFDLSPVPLLRTWLVSGDDTRVLQLQADRFFLNWRARGPAYPSFNANGPQPGLLAEAREAFGAFSRFAAETLGTEPRVTGCEVTMIDVLVHGRHWKDCRDLAHLMPSLRPFIDQAAPAPEALLAQSEFAIPGGRRRVVAQRAFLTTEPRQVVIRFESTVRLAASGDTLVSQWQDAHRQLKQTFDEFIPAEHHGRFETEWRHP
jgi:uncharacterized protein (TIGR04255 family)